MPIFSLITNVPKDAIPKNFLVDASKLITESLSKPESYVSIRIHPDTMMIFGGTSEPCGSAELACIGKLGVEENKVLSKVIGEFIEKQLNIRQDRCYIRFTDTPRAEVGFNGKTFA